VPVLEQTLSLSFLPLPSRFNDCNSIFGLPPFTSSFLALCSCEIDLLLRKSVSPSFFFLFSPSLVSSLRINRGVEVYDFVGVDVFPLGFSPPFSFVLLRVAGSRRCDAFRFPLLSSFPPFYPKRKSYVANKLQLSFFPLFFRVEIDVIKGPSFSLRPFFLPFPFPLTSGHRPNVQDEPFFFLLTVHAREYSFLFFFPPPLFLFPLFQTVEGLGLSGGQRLSPLHQWTKCWIPFSFSPFPPFPLLPI